MSISTTPGRGWRWLRVGEIKRKRRGDQLLIVDYKSKRRKWFNVHYDGQVNIEHTYRRRVKKGKR